ncbi:MAG: hypothetical protein ACPF9I_07270 [Candidatus Thalassarchaeaceae archaeon]
MVMWEDPLDKFRISKSYAVVDINELISALRGAENLSESGIEMMLQSLHHDVAKTGKYSPYEEEAVHFAIYSGAIGKEDATIIMQGPEARGYDKASVQWIQYFLGEINTRKRRCHSPPLVS